MEKYTLGSLFTGIGGLDLGFERTGFFKVKWQCEIDDYATKVLERHWPDVRRYRDIKAIKEGELEYVDIIAGGFPCQDVSIAGKGAGIKGERSGLWFEMLRIIRMVRPKYAVIENVPMLRHRGLREVLCGLAEAGYDAEWGTISAAEVGAPHKRERLFIIAHRQQQYKECTIPKGQIATISGDCTYAANSNGERCGCRADIHGEDQKGMLHDKEWNLSAEYHERKPLLGLNKVAAHDAADNRRERISRFFKKEIPKFKEFSWCENVRRVEDLRERQDIPEPLIRRTRNGLPNYVDRIRCIGNAVVPAVAEHIGRQIINAEGCHN